jgi:hypothetical protein
MSNFTLIHGSCADQTADAVVNADNLPNQQKNTDHCHPCDVLHYLSPLSAFLNWYPKKKLMHMV